MQRINLLQKFDLFSDTWSPRVIAELNGQQVKLARIQGEFVWHAHDTEDELFYVVAGAFVMHLRDREIALGAGDLFVVPRGVDHKPVAESEALIMLFEPATTAHTGAVRSELTVDNHEWI